MNRRNHAFTLVEMLIVVIIIGVLIAILIPVASAVRTRAKTAETQQWLSQLSSAIDRYYQDFRAYPGPLSNDEIRSSSFGTSTDFLAAFPGGFSPATPWPMEYRTETPATNGRQKFTMAENLVLGLLGGLRLETSGGMAKLVYDPTLIGSGPRSLNAGNLKKFAAYIEPINLSWQTISDKKTGEFFDDATNLNASNPEGADDSIVPEFVDKFADPLPILYLRARRGAARDPNQAISGLNNGIVSQPNTMPPRPGTNQYDIDQMIGYTQTLADGTCIGVGKKAREYFVNSVSQGVPAKPEHGLRTVTTDAVLGPQTDPKYNYPYDAFPYLRNPALSGPQSSNTAVQVAREKDKYILISAGADRIYGTDDDITSFGSVAP